MNKLYVNGKEIYTDKTKLKDILIEHGLHFPCGGKGICGKCRIKSKQLPVTDLDTRFLSSDMVEQGYRLACDKDAAQGLTIDFEKSLFSPVARKLEYCNIIVVMDIQKIAIGISDDEIAEVRVFENDIIKGENATVNLRSFIAKESIELFEKYSMAKADTVAVAADKKMAETLLGKSDDGYGDMLEAWELLLPAEAVYMLPFAEENISAEFLCFLVKHQAPALVIKADKNFAEGLVMEKDIFCLSLNNLSYSAEERAALKASVKYLLSKTDRPPVIYVYSSFANAFEFLSKEHSVAIMDETAYETAAQTIFDNRLKSLLLKCRKRISLLPGAESDQWQEFFILSANDRD